MAGASSGALAFSLPPPACHPARAGADWWHERTIAIAEFGFVRRNPLLRSFSILFIVASNRRRVIQQNRLRQLWLRLIVLPVMLSLIDVAVTLHYQPPGYWGRDRSQLIEANPLVWIALRLHPALLIPGCIGWYALFFFLIFYPPAWIGLRCHVAWVFSHLVAIAGCAVALPSARSRAYCVVVFNRCAGGDVDVPAIPFTVEQPFARRLLSQSNALAGRVAELGSLGA
jgi:hypothetical protein